VVGAKGSSRGLDLEFEFEFHFCVVVSEHGNTGFHETSSDFSTLVLLLFSLCIST
jgi:hypothetical protein